MFHLLMLSSEPGRPNSTVIGHLARGVIEAGWLSVVAILPLAASPVQGPTAHASQTQLYQLVVAFMLAAWVVKGVEEGGWRKAWRRLRENPFFWPVAAGLAVLLLSTATSVAPRDSIRGDIRLQGAVTLLAHAAFFLLVFLHLRDRAQLDRLVSALLLPTLPISLLALLQYLGIDPLRPGPPPERLEWEVVGTLGQHIFLGAYLVMVIPFTLARLWEAVGRRGLPSSAQGGGRWSVTLWVSLWTTATAGLFLFLLWAARWETYSLWWMSQGVLVGVLLVFAWVVRWASQDLPPTLAVIGYSLLLAAQGTALVVSQARGPWLAMLAGALVFLLLLGLRERRRVMIAVLLALALLGGVFVLVLNLEQSPLAFLQDYPILDRLSNLLDVEKGSGKLRLYLWRGVLTVWREHPVLGPRDSLNWLRPWVGYGPETLLFAYEQGIPSGQAVNNAWTPRVDRAHNHLLDLLVTQGALGLAAYVVLVGTFLVIVLRVTWRLDGPRVLLPVALVSAVVGHFAQLQTGIELTVTGAFFWLALAVAAGLHARAMTGDAVEEDPGALVQSRSNPWPGRLTLVYLALTLVGLWVFAAPVQAEAVPWALSLSIFWTLFGLVLLALCIGDTWPDRVIRGWKWALVHYAVLIALGLVLFEVFLPPITGSIYFNIARASRSHARPGIAIYFYQRAIHADPTVNHYYQGLAGMFMLLADRAPSRPGSGDTPPADFRTVSRAQLGSPNREELIALAVAAYEQAVERRPLDPPFRHALIRAYEIQGLYGGRPERLQEVLPHYEELARMAPRRLFVYQDWARALVRAGRVSQALTVAEKGAAMLPDHILASGTLAMVYLEAGNRDRAEAEARKTFLRASFFFMPRRPGWRTEFVAAFLRNLAQEFPELPEAAPWRAPATHNLMENRWGRTPIR